MVHQTAGIPGENGERLAMGGPCRTAGARDAGHNNNRDTSPVDEKAAAKSLALYCKPVELYNIIRSRFSQRPVFLQRCLNYKIHALRQKRIKMTVQVKGCVDASGLLSWNKEKRYSDPGPSNAVQGHQFLPIFAMVTSQLSRQGEVYLLSKATKVVRAPLLDTSIPSPPVSFILPELRKLVINARKGDIILLIAFVDPTYVLDPNTQQIQTLANCSGPVVWGKLSMAALCSHWLKKVNGVASVVGPNGVPLEAVCTMDCEKAKLQHADSALGPIIKLSSTTRDTDIKSGGAYQMRLKVHILGGELGQNVVKSQPANGAYSKLSSVFSHSQSFRNYTGRVEFHYLYYHNRCEKTEITEEFSCPFCLVGCSSFKGLRCHLNCTHDLFNFEYSPTADVQVVNVTCRTDLLGPEGSLRDLEADLRTRNWMFWSRSGPIQKRGAALSGRSKLLPPRGEGGYIPGRIGGDVFNENFTSGAWSDPLVPGDRNALFNRLPSNGYLQKLQKPRGRGEKTKEREDPGLVTDADIVLPAFKRPRIEGRMGESSLAHAHEDDGSLSGGCAAAAAAPLEECGLPLISMTPVRPRAEKNRQAAADRDARNRLLLQKRTFFHSHTAQPMAPEQLLSDRDSEDELDEVIAVLEDRRMLDDFVDVTKDEKEVMHLWNSFVRKQRVLADGHCPWACEAFSRVHSKRFSSSPSLRRSLMLFLIKLWNHHLVEGATIDKCLTIVDSYVQPSDVLQ